ncbi:hypothetical protein POPTR_001G248704v4 [Populus trichocarpa]|uniref:glucan endo-1,3-beta-D-glucosidase n=1 Tax=Populus trichocarpa TaxID=3694 RepID=A0A2K2C3L9_POPTR|nr:hypothetical protein POPTR_001G248704v4 [Populus trichocarpa]
MCRSLILCFWTMLGSLLWVSNPFLCRNSFSNMQLIFLATHHLSSRFVQGILSPRSLAFCFFLFSSQVISSFVFKLLLLRTGQMLMRFLRCRIIDRPAFWQRRATTHRFLTNIFAAI